jgi:hypothetical protein
VEDCFYGNEGTLKFICCMVVLNLYDSVVLYVI